MTVMHAHRTKRTPEHPRLVARDMYHVDGEHRHPHKDESPSFYFGCIWCVWPSASTRPEVEIECHVVPGGYPGGVAGYFDAYKTALGPP